MHSSTLVSAVNFKGIWPRRAPKARAVHAGGGGGGSGTLVAFLGGGGDLAEAAASAASMQFTALLVRNVVGFHPSARPHPLHIVFGCMHVFELCHTRCLCEQRCVDLPKIF